jgi:hypothetical protein
MTQIPYRLPVPLAVRDTDFDGLSDYDEIYLLGTNPYSSDSDRDGIVDLLDPDPRYPAFLTEVVEQLGTGQGQHYSIVLEGPLVQVSALDGRSGLDGQGLIFYQYGDQTLSDLRQDDLNRFAQVNYHLHRAIESQASTQIDRD